MPVRPQDNHRSYRLPPGPGPLPLIGNLHQILAQPRTFIENHLRMYGLPLTYYVGPQRVIFGAGPEFNRHVLVSHAAEFLSEPIAGVTNGPIFKGGILHVDGDAHKRLRRLMQPAFHKQAIQNYQAMILSETRQHLGQWGETIDLAAEMHQLTLRIILHLLFGQSAITANVYRLSTGVLSHIGTLWGAAAALIPWSTRRRAARGLNHFVGASLQERRSGKCDGNDLLQLLMEAQDEDGQALTDSEIIDQMRLLLFAGHDTSAAGLVWMIYLLAQYPEWTERILAEVSGIADATVPTPILDMFMSEAMRILPPVPGVGRKARSTTYLDEYVIPAGTTLYCSISRTHHLPDIYPDPDVFRPERFAPDAPQKFSPYEYLPFGVGPRMCLGAPLAMLEMKLILITLLTTYRLDLVPDQTIEVVFRGTTASPREALRMRVFPQDGRVEHSRSRVFGNLPAAEPLVNR